MIPIIPFLLLQSQSVDPARVPDVAASVTAARVAPAARPVLDGRLDDPAWTLATPVGGLMQRDPQEGAPATERVDVRILYDAEALYIGARLFDSSPQAIIRRLGRRDATTHSDEFRVLLDSYHDRRTAFEFIVNAAGVKRDVLLGDDGGYSDDSWDAVWEAATTVDSLGWTVEMRIPLSQLRFSGASAQVWGVRFERWIQRKNELDMLPLVRKTESGVASRFADLQGLEDLPAPKRVEVLPYVVGRGHYDTPDSPSDPFDRGSAYRGGVGADLKYGVTSNLTLDATVNPDFGQVDLDPAFVNLTAFEVKLEEKRPFFVEGGNIFGFAGNGSGLAKLSDRPQYFYSRRIGQPPQGSVTADGQFSDVPTNSTILGAAKLSGKRASGWSIGILDALTAREWATVADTTTNLRHRDEVEPVTNYFVGRLKRDLRHGNTTLGLVATAVNRDLDTPALDMLGKAAYTGGVDLFHRWGHHTYTLAASLGGSYLRGDTLALQQAQHSSSRYYQRPDARRFSYDPHRTSLAGVTGDVFLNRVGGPWNWSVAGEFVSPGFEVNDLGFQERVDRISAEVKGRRRWSRPGKVFLHAVTELSLDRSWNYDGDAIQRKLGLYAFGQFRNFWIGEVTARYSGAAIDDRLTRGGPLARTPPSWYLSADGYTDDRKKVSAYAFAAVTRDTAGGWSLDLLPKLTLRPSSAVSLSLAPGYFTGRFAAQYVTQVSDPTATGTLGARYVFAELIEHQVSATLHVNATFSPTLSFQLYAQPFTFTGAYRGFKELQARKTFAFNTYGRDNGSTVTPGDPAVCGGAGPAQCSGVDPDGPGPAPEFALYNPDFRTRSLSVKAVWRWEYRPGSTIFFAWTHSRSGYFPYDATFDVARDLGRELLHDRPTNVLLVKFNYWLSL
ncbi:MAG: hypothetical protein AUF60_02305 [Gemmatimonadetes bacterium 13_1_20CM_69_28]|nr:MAG: hypothetical protein AUF60_02305 [Gemmatimonadetes bacterium 13_1_20CM_69_28]